MSNVMRNTRLGMRLALLAFAFTLVLAETPFATARAQTGTIVVAQSSDVLTLDPSVDTSPISLNVFKNIYVKDAVEKPALRQIRDLAGDHLSSL